MTVSAYRFHREATATLAAPVEVVFALLDDPAHIGAHMGRRSAMMAGALMRTETDTRQGQAVGSVIRMAGRVLGVNLTLEEAVIERVPPRRKVWETLGDPKLLVIGRYRMGFDLTPVANKVDLKVWIDYDLPARGVPRWLRVPLGRVYADWCVRQMVREAAQAFGGERP